DGYSETDDVSRCEQARIFSQTKMIQLVRTCQKIESTCCWIFYLREFLKKLVSKHILKLRTDIHGSFSDYLKAFVNRGNDFFGDESPRLKDFLYFGILNQLADFLVELCTLFGALANTAEQPDE